MSGPRRERPKRYRQFVESGLAKSDEDFKAALKESPRSIGSNTFRAWVDELYQKLVETHKCPEDASFRRITEPLAADAALEILADVFGVSVDEFRQRRRNSPLRGVAARFLCRYAGSTQREVAAMLQAGSGAAISQQLKKVAGQLPKDQRLRHLVEEAEERFNALRNDEGKRQRHR